MSEKQFEFGILPKPEKGISEEIKNRAIEISKVLTDAYLRATKDMEVIPQSLRVKNSSITDEVIENRKLRDAMISIGWKFRSTRSGGEGQIVYCPASLLEEY